MCRHTDDIAPRLHNLVRLAELAETSLAPEQLDLLADLNPLNIEGRYPGALFTEPTIEEAYSLLARTEELFQWLKNQL